METGIVKKDSSISHAEWEQSKYILLDQLSDLARLHELSLRLATALDLKPMLLEFLEAVVALQEADLGLLSLCETDDQGDYLQPLVSVGFSQEQFDSIERTRPGQGACGKSLKQGEQTIVQDIELDPSFSPYKKWARSLGIHAVHSTPLISRSGNVTGVFTVYFRKPHLPSEHDMQLSDLYARQAVDFIENARLREKAVQEMEKTKNAQEALARSEMQFRNLLDKIPAGAYTCDENGLITYFNKQAVEVWGRAPKLLDPVDRYCGSFKLYLPDGKPIKHDQCWMALALQNKSDYLSQEILIERPDKSYCTALAHASPIFDKDGHISGAVNVLVDISERKKMENAIQESEAQYRAIVETTPECVKIVAADGSLLAMNKAGLDMVEASGLEEVLGSKVFSLIAEEYQDQYKALHKKVCEGIPVQMEFEIIGLKGTRHFMETHAVPLRDSNGVIKHLAVTRNITNRKIIEKKLSESEEKFRTLADSIPQLAWMTDQTGAIFWYNQRWYDYTGTSFDEMKDWGWQKVHDPVELPRIMERWKSALSSGESWEDTFPLRRNDGEMRWHLSRAHPVRDQTGKIVRWFGTNTDISEQITITEALKKSDERWSTLTEAMPQLVWIDRGSDGYCEYLSSQWEEYTGIPVKELLGFEWLKLLHPDDQKRTMDAWQRAVEDKQEYNIEYRLRRHDGEYRWFKTRGVPRRDESGNIITWYGTCTDIQELMDAKQRAEAASIAKSEFLANMSHEIRTPMNAVVGLTSLLQTGKFPNYKQQEFLQTLQLSAQQLMDLINDLLDIAKIESQSVEFEEVPFRLEQIVDEILKMNSVKAKEKNIELHAHAEENLSLELLGDPLRLRQVLLNLVGNAVKFTEKGSVLIKTHTVKDSYRKIAQINIDVIDTGIGIPKEKLQTVFNKFSQADASMTRKYGGTGLGLSITNTLVEAMGGSISLRSVVDKGSVFSVSLTLPYAESQETKQNGNDFIDTASEEKEFLKVLLVEDYKPNAIVATAMLESLGYPFAVAENGKEALDMLEENIFDVVLMDVQMPELDGYQATGIIRQREAAKGKKRIPIIGVTAHALAGDREKCLSMGMDNYLSKPFRQDELKVALEKYSLL